MFSDKQAQRTEVTARPRVVFEENQMKPYQGGQIKIQFLAKNIKVKEVIEMNRDVTSGFGPKQCQEL